jgi:cell division transport system ATP-binding protein
MGVIACENLAMGYNPEKDVLSDVTFTLQPGSFHFLSGASGVGKTTLLSILALIQRPGRGSLRMFGHEVNGLPRDGLPSLRRRIGMVAQDYKLLSHLSVSENIALPLKVVGEKADVIRARTEEMLEWVGLKEYFNARPDELSGGQKQRVCIARSVIAKPDVLLADEPSGNLDLQLSLRFMYLFEALHKMGTTVLFATHDDYLISQFSYPVLKLKDGMIEKVRG